MNITKHQLWFDEDNKAGNFTHGTSQENYEVVSEDATSYIVLSEKRSYKEVVYKDPESKMENCIRHISHKPYSHRLLYVEVWLPEGEDVTPYFEQVLADKMSDLLGTEERLKAKKRGITTAFNSFVVV